MELFFSFLAFVTLLSLASALGWTTDSRDSSDRAPTANGTREVRSY